MDKKEQLEYYKINNKKQAEKYKYYNVKIPKYQAEIFDKKLKENNEKWSTVAKKAIEKYINNH